MTTPESLAARVLRTVGVYLGVTLAIMLGMYFQFRRTAKPQKAPPRF